MIWWTVYSHIKTITGYFHVCMTNTGHSGQFQPNPTVARDGANMTCHSDPFPTDIEGSRHVTLVMERRELTFMPENGPLAIL